MKNIMIKSICALIIVSAVILSCSKNILPFGQGVSNSSLQPNFDDNGYWHTPAFKVKMNSDNSFSIYSKNSVYGAYLAGRVAHLRQDFSNAAEYYEIVIDKDKDNATINRAIYVILSSLGEFDKAVPYAEKEIEQNKKETLAPLIVAIKHFADGNYVAARESLQLLNDDLHKILINPLFEAWTYAGEHNEEKAIESIEKIKKDPSLLSLPIFHKAMIYDYLGNKEKANENYALIINQYPQEVTFRYLEIITDFYVRIGDKNMAHKISKRYNDNSILSLLLKNIDHSIDTKNADTPAVIDTPQKGLAEALFNIGTLFRLSNGGTEFAQIYLAASSYLNPDYDVAHIALANVFEDLGLYKEANKHYAKVPSDSGSYFIAQIKLIENLNTMEEYDEAEKKLRDLLKIYPNNTQLLSNLGDIMANQDKYADAIEIYLKALKEMKSVNSDAWPLFYSLAVSYHRNGQQELAEEHMLKALDLSKRNPNVLNYLGYMWLDESRNVDEAVKMILEAYRQYPYEGHIIDSLGWVYYRIGNYKKAIEYLEQASEMNSGNAVISDHLGDAYWFGGRKNEAIFQWKHALVLKEDADSLNKKAVKNKIEEGITENNILTVTDENLLKQLNDLSMPYDK